MGYSASRDVPKDAPMPTESGVPPFDPEARRRYYQRNADLHEAIKRRAAMGMVHTRPEPTTGCPFEPLSYEQQLELHCVNEAQREVECWFRGEVYRWRSFRYMPGLR